MGVGGCVSQHIHQRSPIQLHVPRLPPPTEGRHGIRQAGDGSGWDGLKKGGGGGESSQSTSSDGECRKQKGLRGVQHVSATWGQRDSRPPCPHSNSVLHCCLGVFYPEACPVLCVSKCVYNYKQIEEGR